MLEIPAIRGVTSDLAHKCRDALGVDHHHVGDGHGPSTIQRVILRVELYKQSLQIFRLNVRIEYLIIDRRIDLCLSSSRCRESRDMKAAFP